MTAACMRCALKDQQGGAHHGHRILVELVRQKSFEVDGLTLTLTDNVLCARCLVMLALFLGAPESDGGVMVQATIGRMKFNDLGALPLEAAPRGSRLTRRGHKRKRM